MARHAQGLRLDPSTSDQPVVQEPVQVGDRGRLGIPVEVSKGLSWLSVASAETFALGVLDDPGRIVLHAWEPGGEAVVAERTRMIGAGDYQGLRMLEDRYRRISIAKDGRLTLTLSHQLHLGSPLEEGAYVFVVRVGDVVEILSLSYRDKQIARAADAFPNLP